MKMTENTCRLCLNESPEIVEEIWEGCDVLNKLSVCLSHHISLCVDLPRKICYPCVNTVHDIYAFHQQISQNEVMLKQRINTSRDKYLDSIKQDDSECEDNGLSFNENLKTNELPLVKLKMKTKDKNECQHANSEIIDKVNDISKENLNILNQIEPFYGPGDDIPLSVIKENKSKVTENVIVKVDVIKKFMCLTCFEMFNNQLELLRHYQHIELERFNKNNKDLNDQIKPVKYKSVIETDGSVSYKCDRCYKRYKHKKYIDRHIKSHIDKRPYLCKLCGKTYQTASIIVAHGKMHTGEMYSCTYNCGYKSVHKHVVMDHEKRHRKEYKYKCQTCGKGFQVKTWYQQHQNVHNDVKPFSCELCGKTFHLHKYLMTHKSNVHPQSSGRKPWVCKQCFMPCDSKNSLNLHLKQSHGIVVTKPTLCDICGKVVRDTHQLKNHKRAVHLQIKPFSCSFCNKSFQKKFTLKVHEQTHTGKRYLCSMCDRMFTRNDTLLRHLKNCHTDCKNKCDKCEKSFSSKLKLSAHQKICTSVIIEDSPTQHKPPSLVST